VLGESKERKKPLRLCGLARGIFLHLVRKPYDRCLVCLTVLGKKRRV